MSEGKVVEEGSVRDHIVPRRFWEDGSKQGYLRRIGAPDTPDDPRNLWTLCATCHSKKTLDEGSFGAAVELPESVTWNDGQWGIR